MSRKDAWTQDVLTPALAKKGALRRSSFTRSGGEPVEVLYSPADPPENIGFPGQFPFTRGVQATQYRGRFWTMRQYAGFGTARESNTRYRYLLAQGTMGLRGLRPADPDGLRLGRRRGDG